MLFWYIGLFFVQLFGGIISGSIALRSEALHVLSDAFSSLVSLSVVIVLWRWRSGSEDKIRGLGGIVSALLLWVASGEIYREALGQFVHPTHLVTKTMFFFALVGAVFNYYLHAHVMVHDHSAHSDGITCKSLDLHILLDLYQSIAVIAASIVIFVTGWHWVDPVLSIVIATWMTVRTFFLVRQGFRVYRGQE